MQQKMDKALQCSSTFPPFFTPISDWVMKIRMILRLRGYDDLGNDDVKHAVFPVLVAKIPVRLLSCIVDDDLEETLKSLESNDFAIKDVNSLLTDQTPLECKPSVYLKDLVIDLRKADETLTKDTAVAMAERQMLSKLSSTIN